MKLEIKIPDVGESVSTADIGGWEKQSGALVQKGDILVILETDKASMEVPAEQSGILNILKQTGEKAAVGEVIGFIDASPSAQTGSQPKKDQTQAGGAAIKQETLSDKIPAMPTGSQPKKDQPQAGTPIKQEALSDKSLPERPAQGSAGGKAKFQNTMDRLSPSVRRLVETQRLNPLELVGTGRGGRLTKEDVLKPLQQPLFAPNQPEKISDQALPQKEKKITRAGQRRETMTRIRKTTAQRLVQSQQSTATLSTFNEADLSRIIEIRKKYQEEFTKKHGIKLGFMSFFVKAVVSALKKYPQINAFIEGTDIIYNDHQHIGIAVSAKKGLVVPVLFHAESLSLADIEKKILEYRDKALSRKLNPDDLLGGTFTISNGGVFGSLLSTPILNPPQSGILGMHKIEERPVAIKGRVEIRPMMYITLSYDHRIVDGRESVGFLVKVKEGLEEPARLIMDI